MPRPRKAALFKRDRSPFFWMRYRDEDGSLRRQSTGMGDRTAAEIILEKRLAEVAGKSRFLEDVRFLRVQICLSASQEVGPATEREERTLTKTIDIQSDTAAAELAEYAKQQVLQFIASRRNGAKAGILAPPNPVVPQPIEDECTHEVGGMH